MADSNRMTAEDIDHILDREAEPAIRLKRH